MASLALLCSLWSLSSKYWAAFPQSIGYFNSGQIKMQYLISFKEINLDLVQFPKPVYVTEVRIIPLGARVQADFPGGVRLGATNPTQFQIEFFVNDLGKPGASTFETLGAFEYDQNGKINLECAPDESFRKIPTDGLVLKGLYTTITLAVYGTLTKNLAEQLIQPVVNTALPNQPNTIADAQQIISGSSVGSEWSQDNIALQSVANTNYQTFGHQPEPYQPSPHQPEIAEYYNDIPKDPRGYHPTPETEWDKGNRSRDADRDRSRDMHQERDHLDRRGRRYSRSQSRDRERPIKEYHENNRDRDFYEREHERVDYRYRDERDDRKRPRTPPIQSPKTPHSPPHVDQTKEASVLQANQDMPEEETRQESKEQKTKSPEIADSKENLPIEETNQMDVEEFEPILSDEDILDDTEHYQDTDYDYTAYTNNDDILRQFIPGGTELQKYPNIKKSVIKDNTIEVEESLKTTIIITDDYLKSSITKYLLDNFSRHNTEIKEEFVHLCEKLIGTIGDYQVFVDIMKIHNALRSITSPPMNSEDRQLVNQTGFIIETITDWLKIALNYEMANVQDQPAYKIRHIKCGVRLAEWLCHSEEFIQYIWHKRYNLHKELLDLYNQEFMALSIKLMVLKALDTYLLHKFAIEKFLIGGTNNMPFQNGYFGSLPANELNGYKIIVEAIQKNPLVRIKFSLSSILKKLNLYEVLFKMHSILIKLRNVSHDISAEEINLITKSLNQILNYCNTEPFTMSQPKRFLPVAKQFEISRNNTENVLVHYFKMFNLLQCFILLLTYPSTLNLPPIKTPIFEIVSVLLETPEGLHYLSENCETINVLLKCFLRTDEEMQYNINDCVEVRSHNLGLRIAYKLQSLYHIESLLDIGPKYAYDCESVEIIDQLHGLFCLTFSSVGKISVGEVLATGDNLNCLLQFFESANAKSEWYVQKLKKSPVIGYILDLLYFVVVTVPNIHLLAKYSSNLLYILNLIYDESVSSKVNEIKSYLIPLENVRSLSYNNISPFLEMIEKHTESLISYPGPVITCLRIIQHLGISKHHNKSPIISENPLCSYVELKYKHVILQLYSLDGTTVLIKLLQKLCNHFEQPGLHSSIFVSNQGLVLANIIHPAILLLKKMMAYVVQCRNTDFKDLTCIPVLLKTYNLLNSFLINTNASSTQECKVAIIDTLLVYTQPVSEEIHEKDALSKTLWSQMLGEVIRFITTAPYTFISGLLILSELLPLPLPIQTRDDLLKDEISWAINLRKLWSAHLHPHSGIIQETVNKICTSTQPQLLNLLRRICVQISDLAANSALIIARGILDTVYHALLINNKEPCSSHVARLLNFLACLVTHSTIKCAVLHLIHTKSNVTSKIEDKYTSLIPLFSQILKLNDSSNSHIQAQECILSIIQSFCDVEITLLQNSVDERSPVTSEIYLANAMPIKEHLVSFITILLNHLAADNSFVTYLPVVRTLLLLTEHNYGFYYLREHLLEREELFLVLLKKLAHNFSKTSAEYLSTINTLVEFLRVCLTTEENDGNLLYDPRSIMLSIEEVKHLIGWNDTKEECESSKHPFSILEEMLQKETEEDTNFETILEGLSLFLKQLTNHAPSPNYEIPHEVLLPVPEPLLKQYACRITFSSSDACDERLTDRYWLTIPTDEGEGDLDTIPCDLFEICRQMPPEFNLIKEVEKLCRISRTDPPNFDNTIKLDEEQRIKARKPFITPMRPRGFPRTAPQRPDLFRSRPPNTSRPPSLHVDDFVALETCGAQPTGPTGYNKLSREILASSRMSRGSRGRAFVTSERSMQYNRHMPWWGAPMGRGPYF